MAYIGSKPSTKFSAAAKVDTFTGDGSTTTFDLANIIPAGGENALQVFVNNVRQKPGASNAFTVGNDGSGDLKRVTFTEAPAASDEIYVITPFEATNISEVGDGTITSAKIADGTIANVDVSPSAAITDSKLATLTTASKVNVSALSAPGSADVFLRGDRTYGAIPTDQIDTNAFNISLLGFKMAVNEGLTVFNLVDGVVDEFNDESGTDESEGSNDTYNATCDFYVNSTQPSGIPIPAISAGFTTTAVTEPDTSTAGTNPAVFSGTTGSFVVPTNVTSICAFMFGAGGGKHGPTESSGGGGFSEGTLAVTPGQTIEVLVGEGGSSGPAAGPNTLGYGYSGNAGSSTEPTSPGTTEVGASGGGLSGLFNPSVSTFPQMMNNAPTAPGVFIVAGGGGSNNNFDAGAGGGLTGDAAGPGVTEQTNRNNTDGGGGGDQEQGGQGGCGAQSGQFLRGGLGTATVEAGPGNTYGMGGGGGYYGGGGGGWNDSGPHGGSGGGSSYYGHPQITSGSTEEGAADEGGGVASPHYVACTNEGSASPNVQAQGEDGYVLIAAAALPASTTSTTIISTSFSATSVPTSSRIVVFEENVDTPTLNTDIIASISRDGGSTYTTATLSDSGYVTGSSGQRILTGQATISGQPSGQSMRWKLALANNTVKIHGVSLQWS